MTAVVFQYHVEILVIEQKYIQTSISDNSVMSLLCFIMWSARVWMSQEVDSYSVYFPILVQFLSHRSICLVCYFIFCM